MVFTNSRLLLLIAVIIPRACRSLKGSKIYADIKFKPVLPAYLDDDLADREVPNTSHPSFPLLRPRLSANGVPKLWQGSYGLFDLDSLLGLYELSLW